MVFARHNIRNSRKRPQNHGDFDENEAILNDSALVEGLRLHDPAAVQHLSECWLPSVWRYVFVKAKGDRHLAEDIVGEAVLALIKAVSDPATVIGNPGGWLRSVANHKLMDHFRAAARVQHLIDQAKQSAPVADKRDAAMEQELQERREEIRQVMDAIPEQTRMALEWKYIDKLSVREIAVRLDVTEKSAESILFRGRRDFRQRLVTRDNLDESFGEQVADEVKNTNGLAPEQMRVADLPLNSMPPELESESGLIDEKFGSLR